MVDRRAMTLAALVTISACSSAVQSSTGDLPSEGPVVSTLSTAGAGPTEPAPVSTTGVPAGETTTAPTVPTTTVPTTTVPTTTVPTTTVPTTTVPTTTVPTTTVPTTTTTTLPPLDVYDATCVVRVGPGDGLTAIADRFDDDTVDADTLIAENGLDSDVLEPGQLLDVCVDNGLNDIDGATRTERNAVLVRREVEAQQVKLNELFADHGIRDLEVDGISGPVTRQRLCGFRLAAGLPVSTLDMIAGSEEEQALLAAETLEIPFTSAILADRWALIDQTCQIMFVGVGTERLQFVFPTSTGLAEFPTRDQTRSMVFKYNSASANGGWHNSLTYPAAEDNPLNGNMYRPLYFDRGQAIHGANNVPRSPASHGCARLRVEDMDLLLNWLGLDDVTGVISDTNRIDLAVNVQGRYVDR